MSLPTLVIKEDTYRGTGKVLALMQHVSPVMQRLPPSKPLPLFFDVNGVYSYTVHASLGHKYTLAYVCASQLQMARFY